MQNVSTIHNFSTTMTICGKTVFAPINILTNMYNIYANACGTPIPDKYLSDISGWDAKYIVRTHMMQGLYMQFPLWKLEPFMGPTGKSIVDIDIEASQYRPSEIERDPLGIIITFGNPVRRLSIKVGYTIISTDGVYLDFVPNPARKVVVEYGSLSEWPGKCITMRLDQLEEVFDIL